MTREVLSAGVCVCVCVCVCVRVCGVEATSVSGKSPTLGRKKSEVWCVMLGLQDLLNFSKSKRELYLRHTRHPTHTLHKNGRVTCDLQFYLLWI